MRNYTSIARSVRNRWGLHQDCAEPDRQLYGVVHERHSLLRTLRSPPRRSPPAPRRRAFCHSHATRADPETATGASAVQSRLAATERVIPSHEPAAAARRARST